MKQFLFAICLALFTQLSYATDPKETKKVCVDIRDKAGQAVKDTKTGQVKQNCKLIKQHKKLDGQKIPDKK